MSDEQNPVSSPAPLAYVPPLDRANSGERPRVQYKRRARRLQALVEAQAPPEKPKAVQEQEAAMRAAGLLGADLPEADVLKEAPEDLKARLTRAEKDKLSLAEAIARAAEIEAADDGSRHGAGNEFDFDPRIVPAGWHYEWKRDTVLNERSPAYFTALAKSGWRAVPRDRHPEMMPSEWPGETIMRGGMILMQIPAQIVQARRQEDYDKARGEVQNKLAQLSGRSVQGKPTFERNGRMTRDFGPIQSGNEQLFQGQIVNGQLVQGGRSIVR